MKIGDIVTTDFYPKDKHLPRRVIKIEPAQIHSQSGVWVTTIDKQGRKLDLDSAWYKPAGNDLLS